MTNYPKRLIEVDLPIRRISEHARREKNIRQGHISTLHIWWARRPLAACRAVICAALWPDPADKHCPQAFRDAAADLINAFAYQARKSETLSGHCSGESLQRWLKLATAENRLNSANPNDLGELRNALLDFIADFADWDNSGIREYLETARLLTQIAHSALSDSEFDISDCRLNFATDSIDAHIAHLRVRMTALPHPLVVDPFAGGGAIPLEALRVGADAFASDLNPVAVLLNKVVLEHIPKYGQQLADEVYKWGEWVKEQAEKELAEFYPKDPDGATPIAYLWARTIPCEGPGCGVDVPMINQLWIKKKGSPTYAFRLVARPRKAIDIEIVENPAPKTVNSGTTRQAAVTCPRCGYTTPAERVRLQASEKGLGTRLMGVVLSLPGESARRFRAPNKKDLAAIQKAEDSLKIVGHKALFSEYLKTKVPLTELRRISVPLYGLDTFDKLFLARQKLALDVVELTLGRAREQLRETAQDPGLQQAVLDVLALAASNIIHYNMSLSTYLSNGMVSAFIQGTSLAMRSDFAEANPTMPKLVGGLDFSLKQIYTLLTSSCRLQLEAGTAECFSATEIGLPDDGATIVVTDPPYYDSVPYSHLSDVFYIWLRACLRASHDSMFGSDLTEKTAEIVEDRAHSRSPSKKRADFYEHALTQAFSEIRRIVEKSQLMILVFAHKSTRGWESMLNGLVSAGWTIVSSWPIDTERPERMNAYQNASLLSSVHVVCRPLSTNEIGDWRDVLSELPKRIHTWMPRLAKEGVVGADAIFACLGPALEIFSQYSRVEKASGEQVTLKEYLEYVWAAVAKEALNMIFEGADATGFEEDARLTAMWLWTLSTKIEGRKRQGGEENEERESDDVAGSEQTTKVSGYFLEYDAARKIAQGLGAHLERLTNLVEVQGDKARLLPASERTRHLFGKDEGRSPAPAAKRKQAKQLDMFETVGQVEEEDGGWGDKSTPRPGETALDRVHQSMILFAAGRIEALKRFLVENGAGADPRFWRLAQALSALYPSSSDEKRWVDGVLARKKGLGF
ncbi:MAG: DUF1156 domain-containing protein [Chloroflexi bacterium]|nr:DUF1156 domain-containing protein [Chloroflexota bacterium]